MPLSGLEIYKHLPKGNCKECGLATCLAFAMKVAGGQATLEECPRLDEKAKAALGEANAPPQQLVTIGTGDNAVQIGQETVLYRHEDKFYHPTAISVCISDDLDDAAIQERCTMIAEFSANRMGKVSRIDLAALDNVKLNPTEYAQLATRVSHATNRSLILMSANPVALRAAGEAITASRPLLWAKNAADSADDIIQVAKDLSLPLCIEAEGFETVESVSEKARAAGLKELVLSPGQVSAPAGCEFLAQTRRAAIMKKHRPLGYPIAMAVSDADPVRVVVDACWYILRYAGIVVMNITQPQHLLAIIAARQDIYTNPQIPVQVTSGLHEVGEPTADSPVLVTTNFALSYYSIESEIASARIPAHILAVDTEGTSVLTAWAAEKLTGASTADALKKSGLEEKLHHRKVIIPGLVAVLSGAIKDESGWDVIVGPREASGLVSFLKNQWKAA